MSTWTTCNHCLFQREQDKAKSHGMVAVLSHRKNIYASSDNWLNLFVIPEGMSIDDLSDEELAQYDRHCSYAAVAEKCCC